jgi:hypothetical protein
MWKPFPYLITVSQILSAQIFTKNGRVIICFHPRIGKTTLAVIWLIVWFLNLWPDQTVIFATYSEDFALDRARWIRNLLKGNEKNLQVRLAPDGQSVSRLYTTLNGGLISLGIGSGLSGLPCNLLVIDDIYAKFEKAQNPNERKKVQSWFNDAYMRLQPGGSIVVTGARTHEHDLQGYLATAHTDHWQVLSYSAISEGPDVDPLGRPKGGALCPELYNTDALLRIKDSIGPVMWRAQYMQQPIPESAAGGSGRVFPDEVIEQIGESPFHALPL